MLLESGPASTVRGEYRGAFRTLNLVSVAFLTVFLFGSVVLLLTDGLAGWRSWLVLFAALYLPFVIWATLRMLREPPEVGADGLRFWHTDPTTFVPRQVRLAWPDITGAEQTTLSRGRVRLVRLSTRDGRKLDLQSSTLTNEAEVLAALEAHLPTTRPG